MTEVVKKDAGGLVCVMLDVHIWSGRRHLDKTDLIHANPEFRKLPEKDLANLGSVKICDPEDIKKFQAVKGRAERALARSGLPILGSVGVPLEAFEDLHVELVKYQNEFRVLETEFIKSYDARISEWKMKHTLGNPAWRHLFGSIPDAKHVAGRLGFNFHAYRISAPSDDLKPALNAAFEQELGGLKGKLMSEVAAEATKLMADYLTGTDPLTGVVKRREHVTPKTLGPLKRAAKKLHSFRFLDPSTGPVADLINKVLDPMSDVSKIENNDLMMIWALSRALASPVEACSIALKVYDGADAHSLLINQSSKAPTDKTVDDLLGMSTPEHTPFVEAPAAKPIPNASVPSFNSDDLLGIGETVRVEPVKPPPAASEPAPYSDNLAAFL